MAGNDRAGGIALFGKLACRTGRIRRDHGFQAQFADDVTALAQRMDMAVDSTNIAQFPARKGKKLVVDAQEMLARNIEFRLRHQMVDIGHPTCD